MLLPLSPSPHVPLLCLVFFIQSATLYLFIGEFNPFTFRRIIDVLVSYSHFIFCFLLALCLHWFLSFVILSVVFVW